MTKSNTGLHEDGVILWFIHDVSRYVGPAATRQHNQGSRYAIVSLDAQMRVIPVGARWKRLKRVIEGGFRRDGALRDRRCAIHIWRGALIHAMPVDGGGIGAS